MSTGDLEWLLLRPWTLLTYFFGTLAEDVTDLGDPELITQRTIFVLFCFFGLVVVRFLLWFRGKLVLW